MTTRPALDPAIAAHLAAVNSFDVDAIMDTFADDALVNDIVSEFWGRDQIREFMSREFVGDRVTVEPVEVVDNAGMCCVRCKFDGDYDKTGLPDPLIMTIYFRVRDAKIVTLFIMRTVNRSADRAGRCLRPGSD